jgi:hypothetical protein
MPQRPLTGIARRFYRSHQLVTPRR